MISSLRNPNRQLRRILAVLVSTPVLLLGLNLLAFGLQAFWLGYYLDDWVVLYHLFQGGYERLEAYSFIVNRPYGAWPWWLGFNLVGYSPLGWQAWSIFWRWVTLTCELCFHQSRLMIGVTSSKKQFWPFNKSNGELFSSSDAR